MSAAHEARSYGMPPRRDYERAMDAQTDAIAWWRTAAAEAWRAEYVAAFEQEPRHGVLITHAVDVARSTLPVADAIYLAPDAQELLRAASATLPDVEVRVSDLLTEYGFCWLAEPMAFGSGAPLAAFSWHLSAWTDTVRAANLVAYVAQGGRVVPRQVVPLPLNEQARVGMEESWLARVAVAFWLLSAQRLLAHSAEHAGRSVRRRARREVQTVVVVTLRRRVQVERTGSRRVEWSHRWLTRGHWRNQWFPAEQRHKPIWVASHVKGPADKPFVAKRRAFEFNR